MINTDQTHCIIDCFAEVLHSRNIDYRPLYIGIWDAHFEADDDRISYFGDSVDPKEWHQRCSELFSLNSRHWHIRAKEGEAGFHRLIERLVNEPQRYTVVLVVDVFHMPHIPQYQLKHSPHYVIVDMDSAVGGFWIRDPYFSWEGLVDSRHLANAFISGFCIEPNQAHEAPLHMIRRLFKQDLRMSKGRLSTVMEHIVCRAVELNGGIAPANMFASVQEAGVISKRLGGYRFILDYFAEATGFETQSVLSTIDALCKGWESLLLMIARASLLQRSFDTKGFLGKLGHLDELELNLKKELQRVFIDWERRLS